MSYFRQRWRVFAADGLRPLDRDMANKVVVVTLVNHMIGRFERLPELEIAHVVVVVVVRVDHAACLQGGNCMLDQAELALAQAFTLIVEPTRVNG